MDGHQVRLDMPLLSSVHDLTLEKVQFHWKRNCLLNSLKSIMNGYRSGGNCFMEVRQLLDGVSTRFAEMSVGVVEYKLHEDRAFQKEKRLKNSFFKKFFDERDGAVHKGGYVNHK